MSMSITLLLKKLAAKGYQPMSWMIRNNELTQVMVRFQGEEADLDIDQIWGII